tara:strand:- start:1457 stop:1699 length:243 start_codon:yes stop_codon:yes gene_type:complete
MAIKTLSIPQWMDDFLKENEDLSPSKMLQSKIIEIQERRKLNMAEVYNLRKKIEWLSQEYQKCVDEKNKLQDELDKKNKE